MFTGPYIAPTLVVDSVVFQLIGGKLSVLLIQRIQEPFEGVWALPGGYDAAGETTSAAMERILHDKAGVNVGNLRYIEQLYTFDTVARDPRGHAVSVTYMGLGINIEPDLSISTTQNPQFMPVDNLPVLAYDHATIIQYAVDRLRAKLTYTNAIFGLLPDEFTLTQLQNAYEAVFGRAFDKRNFRKKYLSLDLIEPTERMYKEGAHRPARLYRFRKHGLEALEHSFD